MRRTSDVTKLTAPIAEVLDRDYAPFAVCRWVAWGARLQDRAVRLAVVLLLREESRIDAVGRTRAGWVWPEDHLFATAERVFWESPQAARLVRIGILALSGQPCDVAQFAMLWAQSWGAVQREFETIDRAAFLAQVSKIVKQRKRRRMRKRMRLNAEEQAFIDAMQANVAMMRRGLLRGIITVGEVLDPPPAISSAKKAKCT